MIATGLQVAASPRRSIALVAALIGMVAPGVGSSATFEWQTSTPAAQGMSQTALDELRGELARRATKSFLVIRNDRIVYEWYADGHSSTKPHYSASMAKALVGGVTLAVAVDDGLITLDDPAAKFISQWRVHPRKSQITIRQLGSHTSGLEDAESGDVPHEDLAGWQGDFWKRLDPPRDPFTVSRDNTPLQFEPGTRRQYSNPGIAMLGYAVTTALRERPQRDLRTLLRERVMRPIGVPDNEWSCGYGKTFQVEGLPLVAAWGGGNFSARAAAQIGRLMLRQGEWDGRQVIGAAAVRDVTASSGLPGAGGMGWWTNADGKVPALPADAFWAAGARGQVALVVPSLQLIAVRNGGGLDDIDNDRAMSRYFFTPLMATIIPVVTPNSDLTSPNQPSPVIAKLEWAPADSVIRKARGSDNWPMTWADDDAQYTAYGDGQGFEPFVPRKLGLGLAKVEGAPPNFRGVNVRSESVEAIGDDASSYKASGMLMVDGVLQMLVRNVGNARLAWSADHGQSWTWADWKFTESFGSPSFVNFGRNYAGARDDFVYVVSHDNNSAYEIADSIVLARAEKDRLRDRSAWTYYAGTADGQPVWSTEVAERQPMLRNPGKCYRSSMSYVAPLRRYLLVHPVPAENIRNRPGRKDLRFSGGLVIYDAPEPWGPWTSVYDVNNWDIGPGESCSFPTKWFSADGKELTLVFSGDDCFSVRRATLSLRSNTAN